MCIYKYYDMLPPLPIDCGCITSQNPAWWADKKFKRFKKKVFQLDDKAEFYRKDQLQVRCSRCGIYVISRVDNNMERFKEHRKSQKCRKSTGDQPSLNTFFRSTSVTKGVTNDPSLELKVACPGLSYCDDPRITRYLSRTVMPGGGAPHRSMLKKQILASQRHHRRLSKKELQRRIKAAERAQALWSNDHSAGTVFSKKCTAQGVVGHRSGLVIPCDNCKKILNL